MGRKPHRLIQEYFVRGAKLEDSSNRYQHTCKACGEKFPKGRIDGLTNHLMKKCPGISREARENVILELSQKPNQNGTYNSTALALQSQKGTRAAGSSRSPESPKSAPNTAYTGLHALADVVQQQNPGGGDDEQQLAPLPANRRRKRNRTSAAQQQGQSTFSIHNNNNFETGLQNFSLPSMHVNDTNANNMMRGFHQFTAGQASHGPPSIAPTASMVPDQLARAASAANQIMPGVADDQSNYLHFDEPGRPSGHLGTPTSPAIDPQLEEATIAPDVEYLPIDSNRPLVTGPRTQHPAPQLRDCQYLGEFMIRELLRNKKVRGQFTEARRAEVQKIRKVKACMRCRMLKKPCSPDDPCETCRSITTARVWNMKCTRAKLAEELDVFSSGVHGLISHLEISKAEEMAAEPSHYTIHATHFPGSTNLVATFDCKRMEVTDLSHKNSEPAEIDIISTAETEKDSEMLATYFRKVARSYFEHELSDFMRATLLLANNLVRERKDPLLNQALMLWVATQVLADRQAVWFITLVPIPESGNNDDVTKLVVQRREVSLNHDGYNHRVVTHQLHALVEKYCAKVTLAVLSEIERRQMMRAQYRSLYFETFLATIIALNCGEKMSWLINSWVDKFGRPPPSDHIVELIEYPTSIAGTPHTAYHERGPWPLKETSPHDMKIKIDDFASASAELMKLRDSAPPFTFDSDGILRADWSKSEKQTQNQTSPNQDLKVHLAKAAAATADENDTSSPEQHQGDASDLAASSQISDQDTAQPQMSERQGEEKKGKKNAAQLPLVAVDDSVITAWFDSVKITKEELTAAQTAEWNEFDCRSWDLKYISRMLLP